MAYGDPEQNLITRDQMKKAREIDLTLKFTHKSLDDLNRVLGVTRKIPLQDGTTIYYYTTTGTLEDGSVPEGALIPLSQYQRNKIPVAAVELFKWRKATSAESIQKSGYDEAVRETDAKMISDVHNRVRKMFFDHLTSLEGTVVSATTLHAVLAETWGRLQILFEDDTAEIVHFMNPLTIADYLKTSQISMQTAFGFKYVEDFLGMGTVIVNSRVPVNQVWSTAKENIIMYYEPITSDTMREFEMTSDELGIIGINSGYTDKDNMTVKTLVACGVRYFVEYGEGVVMGQIDATPTLGSITVASTAGTAVGDSNIAVSGYSLGTGEKYVYKTGKTTAPAVTYGQKLGSTWTEITTPHDITPTATHDKVTVAAVDANGRAQAAGTDDLTVKTS